MGKVKMGEECECESNYPGCSGTFIRTAAVQKRCKHCGDEWQRIRSRRWKRKNREKHRAWVDDIDVEESLSMKKKYKPHPCTACGIRTRNYKLCGKCYRKGDHKPEVNREDLTLCNRKMEEVIGQMREDLNAKIKVYSSKNMSQRELMALVPSANVETQTSG